MTAPRHLLRVERPCLIVVGKHDHLLDLGVHELLRVVASPFLSPAAVAGCGDSRRPEVVDVLLALRDEDDFPALNLVKAIEHAANPFDSRPTVWSMLTKALVRVPPH